MANSRFSEVRVGRANKRGKFDLSHGITTTYDFGGTYPIFSKLMMPKSSLKGDISGAVRCMPMPLPPFGKCGLHFYGQFVKMSELLRNFGAFVARKTFTSSHASYVPQFLPRFAVSGPVSLMSLLLTPRFSVWCPFNVLEIDDLTTTRNLFGFIGGSSFTFDGDVDATDMRNLASFVVKTSDVSSAQFNSYYGYNHANNISGAWFNGFNDNNRTLANQVTGYNDFNLLCDQGYSIKNADYFYMAPADEISLASGTYSKPTVICVWLTAEGRKLVKILNGLGIQVNLSDSSYVNLMPLFAYYKAWFDIFAPKRKMLWTSTRASKLLDWFVEYGEDMAEIGNNTDIADQGVTLSDFVEFLYDVVQTYATCDPNYITSSVENALNGQPNMQVDSPELDATVVSSKSNVNGGVPTLSKGALSSVSVALLNKLSKYINTNTVIGQNIDAFFKAHFDGYSGTEVHSSFAGSSVLDIELGDVIVTADTDIADAGEFAGVGFGRGDYKIRYNSGDEFGYFMVITSIVPKVNYVQGSDYDVYITKPLELPTPEFDALGYDKLRVAEIYGTCVKDVSNSSNVFGNNAFGYQPRYTGHKVQQSKLMGDFKFNGTKDNYVGMTLDSIITQDNIDFSEGILKGYTGISKLPNSVYIYRAAGSRLQTSDNWRYLGKDKLLTNFDRIFKQGSITNTRGRVPLRNEVVSSKEWEKVGSLPQFDNFVAHFEVSLSYLAPLSNISDSYYTTDGNDMYVPHE